MKIEYLAFIPPITIAVLIVSFSIYSAWYDKNYRTHESTPEHDKGWDKCWDCKKVESTMYFYHNFFGRVYRCLQCSKNHK